MWYNLNKTLSHDAMINIVIGARGCGKTVAAKIKCVDWWINKRKQFVYLRRYGTELDEVKKSLFNDIISLGYSKDKDIEFKNGEYLIDGEVAGYAMSLNQSNYLKGVSYPDVGLIVFDEFVVPEGQKYLKHEVDKFYNMIESIARDRDIRILMLGNSLSLINPYTISWELTKPKNGTGITKTKNNDILLEIVDSSEFKEHKSKTRFAKIVEGSEYYRMAVDNEFIEDDDTFIAKKGQAFCILTMSYNGFKYGFWKDDSQGLYFVSKDIDKSCSLNLALSLSDFKPNLALLRGNDDYFKRIVINNFAKGLVRFESQEIQKTFREIVKLRGEI